MNTIPANSGPKPDPDKTLVEVKLRHSATGTYVWAWVTLREAWIMGQPGLGPPPGHQMKD